jgi:hypothetical protein
MASCAELAADFKMIEEIQGLYLQLEKSATPTVQLLPWFLLMPSMSYWDKVYLLQRLYR